jgi:type I restriction enzyme S subunit
MMWLHKPLEEVADFSLGKMLDQNKNRGELRPYLANVNVRWGTFDLNDLREMRFEASEDDRYGLKYGDIVMCEGGEPGRCAIWKDERPGMMVQKALHRIRPHQGLDHRFLYYTFASKGRTGELSGLFTGATIKHLPREKLAKALIPMPPLRTQERIAELLSNYDDLIENNRKRLALLEEAARLLYREWFVHLRFPGHEHVKVVDGVPEGWARRPLSECATFQSGGTPSKAQVHFWEGDVPWISSGELTCMRICTSTQLVTDEAVQAGSRYADVGTILAVVRGMSLAKEFRLGVASRRVCFNQDLKAFVPNRGIESLYLFHALDAQRDRIRQSAGEASHGTKKLETKILEAVQIPVPSAAIRQHFVEYAAPLHRQMDVLAEQTSKLERARDLLLPRLMNGTLTV